MSECYLTIGAIARQANLQPSAIRYYEQVGLLPPPERMSGQRRYHPDVLGRLRLIAFAQQAGFTIAEIGTLLHGFDTETTAAVRWQMLAARKLPEIEALIARAEGMKRMLEATLDCRCSTLDDCARIVGSSPGRSQPASCTT